MSARSTDVAAKKMAGVLAGRVTRFVKA